MSDLKQALKERSTEGTPRGAIAVWASAVRRDETEWSDNDRGVDPNELDRVIREEELREHEAWNSYVGFGVDDAPERRRTWMVAAALLVVLLVGAAFVVGSGRNDDSSADTPLPSIPTAEERAAAEATRQEQMANGWLSYGNTHYFTGEQVTGWVRFSFETPESGDAGLVPGEASPDGNGMKVYDRPDGTLIGYQLNSLGFVPLERIGEINAPEARTNELGCDPSAPDMVERRRCVEELSPESMPG